jgi:hypothetical protein
MARHSNRADDRQRELDLVECRNMISLGERPVFRPIAQDLGSCIWVEEPILRTSAIVDEQSDAAEAIRHAIALELQARDDAFDVELELQRGSPRPIGRPPGPEPYRRLSRS